MNHHSPIQIDLIRGADADRLLEDLRFLDQWRRLCAACPWATAFQGPDFVLTWYRTYCLRFEPVLIVSRDSAGDLQGLLTLAAGAQGQIAVAGAWQAEYQVWVCPPDLADIFPPAALAALRRRLPSAGLRFTYIPPNAPLDWIGQPRRAGCRFLLTAHRRPLMRLGDGRDVIESLKKSGNKKRLKQMKRLGPLEFRRVTDPVEIDRLLDDAIVYCDVRRMAVNGSAPFRNDPLKRPFHVAMSAMPDLLHTTVLTIGPHLVAAHLGTRTGKELQLGLVVHNPFYASYSPGKFQLYFLAQMILAEGFETLDLTAGGDSYKERFADAWDQVHTLDAFGSRFAAARGRVRRLAISAARGILKRLKISPSRANILKCRLARLRPAGALAAAASAFRRAAGWVFSSREIHVYAHAAPEGPTELVADAQRPAPANDKDNIIRRDHVADLLKYDPAPSEPVAQEFMSTALAQLEAGHHVYTCVAQGRLECSGWLVDRPEPTLVQRVFPGFEFPADTTLIVDLRTQPAARRRGLATDCLHAMLRDAQSIPGTRQVLLGVPGRNTAAIRAAEKSGFIHQSTLRCVTRFGRKRWTTVAPTARDPDPLAINVEVSSLVTGGS